MTSLFAFGGTKTLAVNNGEWGTASSWSPSGVPADGDNVIIPASYTVVIKKDIYKTFPNLYIIVNGILDFDPSGKLDLGINSTILLSSSSSKIQSNGTGSEVISIGGVQKYNGSTDPASISGPAFTSKDTPTSPGGFDYFPLPIKLTHFAAKAQGETVVLSWQTGQEEKAAYFELERSANAQQWQHQATLPAKGSNTTYTYTDAIPLSATGYYRLKLVDVDGRFAYSPVVSVSHTASRSLLVSPNPASSYLQVSLSQPGSQLLELQVINAAGQVVKKQAAASTGYTRLTLEGLMSGTYYLIVKSGAQVLESRGIVVR
ncbi:hypothetical protein SY85_14750 [Flavisolibacter tropicus]|uniref:Secretion system C-terminal sorting domain-containing protein n=2 Tax=Flavisolibacter tropicus TaxID=1492898 RepID=A0A172TX40_9BACT|nr:hypothetical protein SY85_14750 [Flavisolibacter tropicus]